MVLVGNVEWRPEHPPQLVPGTPQGAGWTPHPLPRIQLAKKVACSAASVSLTTWVKKSFYYMATKSDGIHSSCSWRVVCVCVWAVTWRSFTSIKDWVICKLESHGMLLLKLISLCQGIDPESIMLFVGVTVRRGDTRKENSWKNEGEKKISRKWAGASLALCRILLQFTVWSVCS